MNDNMQYDNNNIIDLLLNYLQYNQLIDLIVLTDYMMTKERQNMNQDILLILKKYKESYDIYKGQNNKQNVRWSDARINLYTTINKQDVNGMQMMRVMAKRYEQVIDGIISDGNKVFQRYEEILTQSAQQYQTLKQQHHNYKQTILEQKRQHQTLIDFLNTKINTLKSQISLKQQQLSQMTQKYQYFSFKINQAHNQQRQKIQTINEQFIKSSMHYQDKIISSNKQMDDLKIQLEELLGNNQMLMNQNYNLKGLNEVYMNNIEYLKNKLDAGRGDIIQSSPIQQNQMMLMHQYSSLPKDYNRSLSLIEEEDGGLMLDELKMNYSNSNEYYLNNTNRIQKQVLNISQHYSKFNRTQEFHSKQKSNYEFIIMDSGQGKSFVRKKDKQMGTAQPLKQNYLLKINSKSTDKDVEDKKKDERVISEIKEFKMSQHNNVGGGLVVDPYLSFFKLLVQCEKLNSRYFNLVFEADLGYMYDQFYRKGVPYYEWQKEVRLVLEDRISRKLARHKS